MTDQTFVLRPKCKLLELGEDTRDACVSQIPAEASRSPSATIFLGARRWEKPLEWVQSVRLGSGILNDLRSRAPFYVSDWTDAWNYRVIPAIVLIFFAKSV